MHFLIESSIYPAFYRRPSYYTDVTHNRFLEQLLLALSAMFASQPNTNTHTYICIHISVVDRLC